MATKTVINISPKVFTALLTGLGLAGLGGVTAAVTPATFAFLGPWAPGAFAVATILLAQAAAWLKREQATETKAAVTNAHPTAAAPVPPVAPLLPLTVDQIINGTPVDDAAAHAAATAPNA